MRDESSSHGKELNSILNSRLPAALGLLLAMLIGWLMASAQS